MKKMTAIIVTLFLLAAATATGLVGCGRSGEVETLNSGLEALSVCRPGGEVVKISFAEAMAYHHSHEDHDNHGEAAEDHGTAEHEDEEICVGVATGYQAICYATETLFPNETPDASDLELSVAGAMPGIWDIMELYTGRKLDRPSPRPGKLSLESYTFRARRNSTGRTLVFRIRQGLISPEFFEMKNRGVTCDDAALGAMKQRAAREILSLPAADCFEACQ